MCTITVHTQTVHKYIHMQYLHVQNQIIHSDLSRKKQMQIDKSTGDLKSAPKVNNIYNEALGLDTMYSEYIN